MFYTTLKFAVMQNYKESYSVNKHQHPCYEIVYYLKGQGTTTIENKTYHFEPNTFTVCEPNSHHSEQANSDVKLIYIGFEVPSGTVSLKNGLYHNENFKILEDLLKIHDEMKKTNIYYDRMLNLLTESIIIKLLRGMNEKLQQKEENIQNIIDFIKLNCMKNINVKFISKTFSFNYDYIRRMFKEKTGVSLKDFIQQEKIRYAIDLLKNTNNSIKEISSLSGFSSPSHFGVIFKEVLNMTPKEYVEKILKNEHHKEEAHFAE